MNAPIPLRPDPSEIRHAERRSFFRAAAAVVLAARDRTSATKVLQEHWGDDRTAAMILKAATHPTSTADYLQVQSLKVVPQLSPASASAGLLAGAVQVDLEGINTIRIPMVISGPPAPPFVGEDQPGPVVDLSLGSIIVGPVSKILILSTLSREIEEASADTASQVIGRALTIATAKSVDAALFSANAATSSSPPGLLHGVTPIVPITGGGLSAMIQDIAALAAAIGAAGINPDNMVIITTPNLATKLRLQVGPKFNNTILSSSAIPAGQVIAAVPEGIAVAYSGTVQIDSSRNAIIHEEDTAPAAVPASPTRSAFQTDVIILRVRAQCSWAAQSGAISVINGATW